MSGMGVLWPLGWWMLGAMRCMFGNAGVWPRYATFIPEPDASAKEQRRVDSRLDWSFWFVSFTIEETVLSGLTDGTPVQTTQTIRVALFLCGRCDIMQKHVSLRP